LFLPPGSNQTAAASANNSTAIPKGRPGATNGSFPINSSLTDPSTKTANGALPNSQNDPPAKAKLPKKNFETGESLVGASKAGGNKTASNVTTTTTTTTTKKPFGDHPVDQDIVGNGKVPATPPSSQNGLANPGKGVANPGTGGWGSDPANNNTWNSTFPDTNIQSDPNSVSPANSGNPLNTANGQVPGGGMGGGYWNGNSSNATIPDSQNTGWGNGPGNAPGNGWSSGNGNAPGNGWSSGNGNAPGNGFGNGPGNGFVNGWSYGNGNSPGNGWSYGNWNAPGNGWSSGNGNGLGNGYQVICVCQKTVFVPTNAFTRYINITGGNATVQQTPFFVNFSSPASQGYKTFVYRA
jgi:hypothetical protein